MKLWQLLSDPLDRGLFLPGILAGLAVVLTCALLSSLVVVKRLGFIGQGISHSAFGGVGVAAVLIGPGLAVPWLWSGRLTIEPGSWAEFAVILSFCGLAALGMGWLSGGGQRSGGAGGAAPGRAGSTPEDTAIGIALVGSMALGALLVQYARDHALPGRADVRSWESILFGSVTVANWTDVWLSAGVLAVVAAGLWLLRRPLMFWAVDEESARAFGVRTGLLRAALLLLLTLAVVTSMRVAGVVLATALLVLPAATALRLTRRLWVAVALCAGVGVAGLAAGLELSFAANLPSGASIVLSMVALFALAECWARLAPAAR